MTIIEELLAGMKTDDFAEMIKNHGWHYDTENHYWVRDGSKSIERDLFQ